MSLSYDKGIDKWNAVYKDLRAKLNSTYGISGKSPKTGNPMPAIPYDIAVSLAAHWAGLVRREIIGFLVSEETKKECDCWPLVTKRFSVPLRSKEENEAWIAGAPVRIDYEDNPNDKELTNVQYQRGLRASIRLVPLNIDTQRIIDFAPKAVKDYKTLGDAMKRAALKDHWVVWINPKLGPESGGRAWLGNAITAYQGLIHAAVEIRGLVTGGLEQGTLTPAGGELLMSRIYAGTTPLAINFPDPNLKDLWGLIVKRAEVVIPAVGKGAGELAAWILEQAGKAAGAGASGFLEEVGFYGIAVIAAIVAFKVI